MDAISAMVIEQCFQNIVLYKILGRGNGCNLCTGKNEQRFQNLF